MQYAARIAQIAGTLRIHCARFMLCEPCRKRAIFLPYKKTLTIHTSPLAPLVCALRPNSAFRGLKNFRFASVSGLLQVMPCNVSLFADKHRHGIVARQRGASACARSRQCVVAGGWLSPAAQRRVAPYFAFGRRPPPRAGDNRSQQQAEGAQIMWHPKDWRCGAPTAAIYERPAQHPTATKRTRQNPSFVPHRGRVIRCPPRIIQQLGFCQRSHEGSRQ